MAGREKPREDDIGDEKDKDYRIDLLQKILQRLVDPNVLRKEPLKFEEVTFLIASAKKAYSAYKTPVLDARAPIVVCGDIHGQYRDLIRTFKMHGFPPKNSYLFLGNYIDRGSRSIEALCLLIGFKLTFLDNFHLLRGSHETFEINENHGFKDELIDRFGERGVELWKECNELFSWMPIAALVNTNIDGSDSTQGAILVVHSGIPAELNNLDDLRNLTLPIKTPCGNAILTDLLWSDPSEEVDGYIKNENNVLRHRFGLKQIERKIPVRNQPIDEFCSTHKLRLIVRGRQVYKDGYKKFGPKLVSIFGCTNCKEDEINDAASLLITEDMTYEVKILKPFKRE